MQSKVVSPKLVPARDDYECQFRSVCNPDWIAARDVLALDRGIVEVVEVVNHSDPPAAFGQQASTRCDPINPRRL